MARYGACHTLIWPCILLHCLTVTCVLFTYGLCQPICSELHYVLDGVVDLLREDHAIGAFALTELDKYSIKLSYYVVWDGIRNIEQIIGK